MMDSIKEGADVLFWAFMIIAVVKYDMINKLPKWLSWCLVFSALVGGTLGVILLGK